MAIRFYRPHKSISLALIGFATFPLFANSIKEQTKKPNILFIAVDDLKPWVSAYGDKHAKTPGMDRLAREGVVFQNSYCQQAICAATRASLLLGTTRQNKSLGFGYRFQASQSKCSHPASVFQINGIRNHRHG